MARPDALLEYVFLDRDSTAQGNAASGGTAGVIRTTHISFGPQTLVFSVGYSL